MRTLAYFLLSLTFMRFIFNFLFCFSLHFYAAPTIAQLIGVVGSNDAGLAVGSYNLGVLPQQCDTSFCLSVVTGQGFFNAGTYAHTFFFETPNVASYYIGAASISLNSLGSAANASGTFALYADNGTATGYDANDSLVASTAFSAGLPSASINILAPSSLGSSYYYLLTGSADVGTFNNNYSFNAALVSPVPEPSEWAMMIMGLLAVGVISKLRRKK